MLADIVVLLKRKWHRMLYKLGKIWTIFFSQEFGDSARARKLYIDDESEEEEELEPNPKLGAGDGDGDDDDDGGDDDDDDDDYGGEDDVNVSYEHWLWDLEYAGGLANKILNRIAACINIDGQQWKWKSFST